MKMPSLNAIRAFEAAARWRSFKGAAEELNLTASAVSRHIRDLERALGTVLFVRVRRGVRPTVEALNYAAHLSDAFRIIEEATAEVSAYDLISSRRRKRVTLSINSTFMHLWLADRIPSFRNRYPNLELEIALHDDNGKGGNAAADLQIFFTPDEDASLIPLVNLAITAVCAPTLIAGRGALRSPIDLARYRLLHDTSTRWWERWMAREGLTDVAAKSGTLIHDPVLAIREAVNGSGVVLADNLMAEDLLVRGTLVAPLPGWHDIPQRYCLQQRPGTSASLSVRQFRDWLLEQIAEHKYTMQSFGLSLE